MERVRGSRGGWTEGQVPLENHKSIGFPSKTGPDTPENHKATEPAFYVGPLSTCKQYAISMAFRWRTYDGLVLVVFGSSLPSGVGPPLTKFYGSAHGMDIV